MFFILNNDSKKININFEEQSGVRCFFSPPLVNINKLYGLPTRGHATYNYPSEKDSVPKT